MMLTAKFKKYLPAILGCLSAAMTANSQVADNLQKNFTDYTTKTLQEKIYVQTDKQFFVAGELIWLKLWVVDASLHKPLELSKVAYVDILDRNNRAVAEAKIELKAAEGNGSIYLPIHLPSGNYKLRAYTNWMKNFAADFYFHTPIALVNTQQSGQWAGMEKKGDYDLQFFPEGGNAISGMTNRFGFRLTDEYGKGQLFSGALINEANDTVARFQPIHAGIGSFDFLPVANQRYKSVIRLTEGTVLTRAFPASEDRGYLLALKAGQTGELNVHVETNVATAGQLYLVMHCRQRLKEIVTLNFTNGKANLLLTPDKISEGITHFTLFNQSGQPVAERLFFQLPKQKLEITASAGAANFNRRQKVDLNINTSVNGKRSNAHLSLSVFRLDSLQQLQATDISSYIWLSSDLKGNIEAPAYYFDSANKDAATAIDNLMLTHGWRRFAWKQVLHATVPPMMFPPEYNGQLVTARMIDSARSEPVANVEAYLSVPGQETVFATAMSKDDGLVRFEMKGVYGSSEMIIQPKQNNSSALRLEIQQPFSTSYDSDILPPLILSPLLANTLLEQHIAVQVRNNFTGTQIKQFTAPVVDTVAFYGTPAFTYMLDDFTRFRTMEEVLREYVKPVFVRRRGAGYNLKVYEPEAKKILENDPLILIDGVPVFDYDKVMALDPLQIRKLEVVNARYFYGSSIFDGILHWTSYDRNLAGYELDPGVSVINYEGLQLHREFFSPVYDSEEKANSPVPDFRNLLYWQPDLHTAASEAKQVTFYTSDLPGRYAIVIEGMTADGHFGSSTSLIEVK
jgi:hypothetical protein